MTPTAALLIIGNEILSGRTRDSNTAYLGTELAAKGILLSEVRIVRDDQAAIIAALDALRAAYDYVVTSGGIGPTHDDITAEAVAKAFGTQLELNAEARALLASRYSEAELTPARLKMAHIPKGAGLIPNPVSQAPGFRLGNVFVMAGVPRIFAAMVDAIKAELADGTPLLSRTLTLDVREGDLADGLAALQADFPDLELGSYPSFGDGRPKVAVVARGTDADRLRLAMDRVARLAPVLETP
jgi:molybdenum cofactor synthesis domain-containing protein